MLKRSGAGPGALKVACWRVLVTQPPSVIGDIACPSTLSEDQHRGVNIPAPLWVLGVRDLLCALVNV